MMMTLVSMLALLQAPSVVDDSALTMLVRPEADRASALITFQVGWENDVGANSLTMQAAHALVYANRAVPIERLMPAMMERNGSVEFAFARSRTSILIEVPGADAEHLLLPFVQGILNPDFSPAMFEALRGKTWVTDESSQNPTESTIAFLEPLLTKTERSYASGMQPRLWESTRVAKHIKQFFEKGHARTWVGGPVGELFNRLAAQRAAYSAQAPAISYREDVNVTLRGPVPLHLIGFPFDRNSASESGPGAIDWAAVLVIKKVIASRMTRVLREAGLIYALDVDLAISPYFTGLFLSIPAYQESGMDLAPRIEKELSILFREGASELEFLSAKTVVEQQLMKTPIERLFREAKNGSFLLSWIQAPAFLDSVRNLDQARFKQVASALFSNERHRFYIQLKGPSR
jgi:hypothetical protein